MFPFSGIAVGTGSYTHMMSDNMASVISQGQLDNLIKEYCTLNKVRIVYDYSI